MVNRVPLLWLVILFIFPTIWNGCGGVPNLPHAKDLCLSEWKDLYKLNYWLDEEPIPHDEFSQEYDPNPEYESSDYETCYRRVFFTRYPIDIRKISLELAPGFSLGNEVRVYSSEKKATEGFADMRAPRFAFSDANVPGIPGKEWNIAQVGEESKAWYYAKEVVDDKRENIVRQIEAEMYFRKGHVVSSVEVITWGGSLEETAAFLLDVARLSEAKISTSIRVQ